MTMPAAVALVSTPDAPPDEGPRAGQPYLTPVPDCEPPFDDELVAVSRIRAAPDPVPAPIRSARGQDRFRPTVDRQQPDPRPAGGHQQPPGWSPAAAITANAVIGGNPVPGSATLVQASNVPPWSQEADVGVRRTTTADLPPARRSASVLARALVEVLAGRRPLGQLRVHCAPEVFAGLAERPSARSSALPHLISVKVCEPADGVAEVSAAFRRAERVRALAFRIQGVDGRWRITALEVG
jgi:hypothetical protein